MFLRLFLCCLVLFSASCLHAEEPAPDYNKHIAPIFRKYCVGCHNATDQEGKFSLDSFEALQQGGKHGAAITPGRSETSRLYRMVTGELKPIMPPADNEAPSKAEIELLKQWLNAGAVGPSGKSDPYALVTPKIKVTQTPKASINAIAYNDKTEQIALAKFGEVTLQSLQTPDSAKQLTGHIGNVQNVVFSHDGNFLVAASGEPGLFGEAKLWKVADLSLQQTFRGHTDALLCAQLSPNGKILATGSYDHSIILWDVATGKPLHTLTGHNGAIYELAFHAQGHLLASVSGDRTVKLWSIPDGKRLDTLKESTKELYAVAFHPTENILVAGGVDNRIRVWKIHPQGKENESPLLFSSFAHEQAVLRVAFTPNGKSLVTCGEDSYVKIWNTHNYTVKETLEKQPDWPTALAVSSEEIFVGRLNGAWQTYALPETSLESTLPLTPLAETYPEVKYINAPAVKDLSRITEQEPNEDLERASEFKVPGIVTGKIHAENQQVDVDWYKFHAAQNDQWIFEINAARMKSPLDSKIEIFAADGKPVPRMLLQAVRNTTVEFRGSNSEQRGFRFENWEEMYLNDLVYLNGDIMKLYQQRRGPDADGQFYPENGNRIAFFDTTPLAHALGETGFMVVPYALGTKLPNNGLPVFTLNFENDDDSSRKLGKDSRLHFLAPETGDYYIRVTDVRNFSGEKYNYELLARRPQLGFKVSLQNTKPTVGSGSGQQIGFKVERLDQYAGAIRVEINNVPEGYKVTSPLTIEAGLYETQGTLHALDTAKQLTPDDWKKMTITATATVYGEQITQAVAGFNEVKLSDKPKVIVHLEQLPDEPKGATSETFHNIPAVAIAPGQRTRCKLRVERNGFNDRLSFDCDNLPHGIIVDDIGLSGILVRENETERIIFLRAEPWVKPQFRLFHAKTKEAGNQVSNPLLIQVLP